MDNKEKYIVIIGDIIESKKIESRNEVQLHLKNILNEINKDYKVHIASEFKITLGDEFQGLLKNSNHIMDIISKIEISMDPIEFRFGIGIGNITTYINFYNTSEIDGPAYHRARKMIENIEGKKLLYKKSYSNILICRGENSILTDELLNSTLSVCTALKSKWTDRQKEIIYSYLLNDENQYKAASALSVGQPSMNKALNNARFHTYNSAINTIKIFLDDEIGVYND